MTLKLFGYAIFYLFLTVFFIYIFTREKMIAEKMEIRRDKFANKIIEKYNIKKIKFFKKLLYYTETIAVAIILVLVIQRFYIGNFVIPTGSMIPTIQIGDRVFANMVTYKFSDPKRNDIIVFEEPMKDEELYTKRAMGLPGETIKIQDGILFIDKKATEFRPYSNLGIGDEEWVVPQKGDVVRIVPNGNYRESLINAGRDVEKELETAFYKEPFGFIKSIYYGLKHKIFNILRIDYDLSEYINHSQDEDKRGAYTILNYMMPNLKFYINGKENGPMLDLILDKEIRNNLLDGKTVELVLDKDYFLALGDNTNFSFDSRMWGFVAKNRIRGKALVRFWPLNRIGLVK